MSQLDPPEFTICTTNVKSLCNAEWMNLDQKRSADRKWNVDVFAGCPTTVSDTSLFAAILCDDLRAAVQAMMICADLFEKFGQSMPAW